MCIITAACVALNVTDFPVVFLDEAFMSTEPASLIPMMKGVGINFLASYQVYSPSTLRL